MQNMKMLVATLVITLGLVFGVGWVLSKLFSSTPSPSNPSLTVDQSQLITENVHTKGAGEDAPFTIVEFSDFQCPACAATTPAIDALLAQYPDRVRVVYRHFPLIALHDSAVLAARFSEAAALQGKFWELHDQLFATQLEWSEQSPNENREYFLRIADGLGLDRAQMEAAVDSQDVINKVELDLRTGEQLGLTYTPSLFLNGQLLDITEIQQIIAQEALNTPSVPEQATGEAQVGRIPQDGLPGGSGGDGFQAIEVVENDATAKTNDTQR